MNRINQATEVDHMTDVAFSMSRSLNCSELFVFFSLCDDEFQKHVLVVKEELLQSGFVLLRLLENWFQNTEHFIVQNVVVLERLDEFE